MATKIKTLARDTWTVGVHGVTGQDLDEGTLPAGTRVRAIESEETIDGTVTRFEAERDGRWYAQRTYGAIEAD